MMTVDKIQQRITDDSGRSGGAAGAKVVYIRGAPEGASAAPVMMLIPGGAVLAFDGHIHIDPDGPRLILTPEDARAFALTLGRLADGLDPPRLPPDTAA